MAPPPEYHYDRQDRLVRVIENATEVLIGWAGRRPVRIVSRSFNEPNGPASRTDLVRDANGRVVQSRVTNFHRTDPAGQPWPDELSTTTIYRYRPDHRLSGWTSTMHALHPRVSSMTVQRVDGGGVRIGRFTYRWSGARVEMATTSSPGRTHVHRFVWDDAGRFSRIDASENGNGGFQTSFHYECD